MRRSTGAIFRATRPETIITSACLGEARNTSEPNLARSFLPLVAFIISITQHARPKVAGHSEDLRAQLISESSRVVKNSGKASAIVFSRPMHVAQVVNLRFVAKQPSSSQPTPADAPRLQLRAAPPVSNQT